MRYALTGATGFVGGVLAKQLRDLGHDVVALVRDPARAAQLSDLGVELVPGDLDNGPALDRLCHGADGFFHLAGWYKFGSRKPQDGQRVNVDGTRNALEAARRAEVPRVVYTSTFAHELAREFAASGLPIVTVMPGLVYGPDDTSQSGAVIARVSQGKRARSPGPSARSACPTRQSA